MNKDILEKAATIIGVSTEEAQKYSKVIDGINAIYFWNPVRGGKSVIIDEEGEKLAATSSVSYERHLKAFLEGKRN